MPFYKTSEFRDVLELSLFNNIRNLKAFKGAFKAGLA